MKQARGICKALSHTRFVLFVITSREQFADWQMARKYPCSTEWFLQRSSVAQPLRHINESMSVETAIDCKATVVGERQLGRR